MVLKNCIKDWHEAIIRLSAETGCRISEALGLEWTHIRNDIIFIEQSAVKQEVGPTKTRSSKRKVMVSPEMAFLFKTMRLKGNTKFVFVNSRLGLFTASDVARQALYPACERAGVAEFGFHGLRRLAINTLLVHGPMKDHVQKVVGHTIGSRVTDKHYREISNEDVLGEKFRVAI